MARKSQKNLWIVYGSLFVIAVILYVVKSNVQQSVDKLDALNTATLTHEQIEQKFEPFRQMYINQRGKTDLQHLIGKVALLVQKYPDYAPGQLFLGQLYFDAGDLKSAMSDIGKSLELDPKQAQVHLLAGNIALMQQNPKLAADHLAQAIAMEPSNAQFWLYLAQTYFAQKNWDEAQSCYEKAIALDSSMTLAYNGLSDCQEKKGQLAKAVFSVQQAIDQTPISKRKQQVIYYRKQARLLAQLGKPNEALLVMGKLTDIESVTGAVLAEKAKYWEQLGSPAKAAELYEALLKKDLRNIKHAIDAAKWRIKAGQLDHARQHILHLQLINPDLPVIHELETLIKQAQN